jgi:hypothetical protein
MELKYILYAKVHTTKEAGEVWTFKFQPTLEEYKKTMSFQVTTGDPYETLGKLNLPDGIGDVIVMDFKPKNVQEKLKAGDKKAVE